MHIHLVRHNKPIDIRQSRKVMPQRFTAIGFHSCLPSLAFNKHEKQVNARASVKLGAEPLAIKCGGKGLLTTRSPACLHRTP